MLLADWFRLEPEDTHTPKGPDGQGWNRLALHATQAIPRCGLRPETRAAALDLLRGMLHATDWSAFRPCDGREGCASCPRAVHAKAPWDPSWIIREDEQGRLWVLPEGCGFTAYGFCYASWEALLDAFQVCKLAQGTDRHGAFLYPVGR